MKRTIYLDKPMQVQLIRYFQRLQRMRGKVIIIKHETVAARLGCSESTARRRINELIKAGHIIRTYVPRPTKGGHLCAYWVRTDVIYRRASMMRQAREKIEQVRARCKRRNNEGLSNAESNGRKTLHTKYNDKDKRARRSINRDELKALMTVAQSVGIDDKQRGYLRGAAIRYGVREAWNALIIAFEDGYPIRDLVRITWGILKKQYPQEAIPI